MINRHPPGRGRRAPRRRPPDPFARRQPAGPGSLVGSDSDLTALWRTLIAPGVFGCRGPGEPPGTEPTGRTLWLIFLDADDRAQPTVFPIDNLPAEPDARFLSALADIVTSLVSDGLASSIPVLLERPGPAQMTESDRRWARAVRESLGPSVLRWPVHLSTSAGIRPFAPDDLLVGAG